MSFSKARLRRFNEDIPQVPSPGRYDPKVDTSVKGAVMPTSKRFPGQSTTSSSLDNIEKATSSSSALMFRTPQLLRKVQLTPRLQYLREKNFDTSGSDILSSDERSCVKSALKKTVSKADYKRLENELNSLTDKYHNTIMEKEMEISMLQKELDEIKIHEAQLQTILEEKSKLASDRHEETLKLKDNLDTMVEKINADREEHQRFINELKSQISELQNKKYELETILAEKQSVIVTINDKYSDLEFEFKYLQEENEKLQQAQSSILMAAEEKFNQFESDINTKLQQFKKSIDIKFENEQQPVQTKLNYFVHEFNVKSKENIDNIKISQEKVKEMEKLIDKKVKEFSQDIKEADERCKYLFRELCKVEEQRDELIEADLEKKLAVLDIQEKYDLCHNEMEECKNTCRKYQITLNTMNETITALSNRLLESDKEVERLNAVEESLELQKQFLEEKSQLLLADIISLRESMDKMEIEIIRDVSALKKDLEAKADLFKEEAMKTELLLTNCIREKQCAIDILLKENEYFKQELEKKDDLVQEVRNREKQFEDDIKKLKSEHLKLVDELSEKLCAQKNLDKILNDKLKNADSVISDLQFSKSQHESQITNLLKKIDELKEASEIFERIISEHKMNIKSLQDEVKKGNEIELRQKQYIDELISDLVLEKERCEAAEVEKDKMRSLLSNLEFEVTEKSDENDKLLKHVQSVEQSLKNCEENINLLENENVLLKEQLASSEINLEKMKSANYEVKAELQQTISDLNYQLSSTKVMKTEIHKLEQENINMAENILELNLTIDSLKEEMEIQNTKISCLEAEKKSLMNVLEDKKNKIHDLEKNVEERNVKISTLNEEHTRKDELCQDLLSQLDSMSSANRKHDEEKKELIDCKMKLVEAEDKIFDLEMQLSEKDQELNLLSLRIDELNEIVNLDEVNQLKEQLTELQLKYETTMEERDKLNHKVADLLGHQNVNQKIKKVAELNLYCSNLQKENESLKLENQRLKSKLDTFRKQSDNKENASLPQREDKTVNKLGSARKKLLSPSVLKPSNS